MPPKFLQVFEYTTTCIFTAYYAHCCGYFGTYNPRDNRRYCSSNHQSTLASSNHQSTLASCGFSYWSHSTIQCVLFSCAIPYQSFITHSVLQVFLHTQMFHSVDVCHPLHSMNKSRQCMMTMVYTVSQQVYNSSMKNRNTERNMKSRS